MLLLSAHTWVFRLEDEFFGRAGEEGAWDDSVKSIGQMFCSS